MQSLPSSAVLRTPVEIWNHILDQLVILSSVSDLFDPANPRHCHRHYQYEWRRLYRRWETERLNYQLVHSFWKHYFSSLGVRLTGQQIIQGLEGEPLSNESRSRVLFLECDVSGSAIGPFPSQLAPNAIIVSLSPLISSTPTEENFANQLISPKFWVSLESMRFVRSLLIDDVHLAFSCNLATVAKHLPNLVSLSFHTSFPLFFVQSDYLHLPFLRTLELRIICGTPAWNEANLATWRLPNLRDLFIGEIATGFIGDRIVERGSQNPALFAFLVSS